jgi:hypothetical protein
MTSKLDTLIAEVCLKNRTGNLSGLAKQLDSNGEIVSSKAYSLLFRAGVLQMCQFAGQEGLPALMLVLSSSYTERFSWFAMNEATLLGDAPLLDKPALLALLKTPLPIDTPPAPPAETAIAQLLENTPSNTNRSVSVSVALVSPALLATTQKVFSDFFGSRWENKLALACMDAGQGASERQIVEQLMLILVPLGGEEFARKCFKDFL